MSFAPRLSALAEALGAAQAVYGEQFNPMITLKALSYFGDGNLESLPEGVKRALRAAVGIETISIFAPLPGGLIPPEVGQAIFPSASAVGF